MNNNFCPNCGTGVEFYSTKPSLEVPTMVMEDKEIVVVPVVSVDEEIKEESEMVKLAHDFFGENVSFEYGKQWCRCSFKTMVVYCPYLSINQIKGAVYALRKKGIITKGRFNASRFDHTNWYAFTEYGKHLMMVG